jgi:SAM-dependent methyltransferase
MGNMDLERINLTKLIDILCCPSCRSDLEAYDRGLYCSKCDNEYPYDGKILKLLVSADKEFLDEEELLFGAMKEHKDVFASEQWEKSKEHFLNTVLDSVDDFSSKAVLHIGCGVDSYRARFDDCRLYFSADITEEMLREIDTGDGAENKFLVNCNIEALPFKSNSIDIMLCIDLIHHFYTRGLDRPLRELIRCLSGDGYIFMEEVNKYSLFRLPYCYVPQKTLNVLRGIKKVLKKNYSRPASYEAPLSIYRVNSMLKKLADESGNREVHVRMIPTKEYPDVSKLRYGIFRAIGSILPGIYKHFAYHWFIVCKMEQAGGRQ